MHRLLLLSILISRPVLGADLEEAARHRLDEDAAAGRPLVAHVLVALADNLHQGIVPVPKGIGNGQNPATNLYWGAGYGVRYFFGKRAGWTEVRATGEKSPAVLDRVVFRRNIVRGGHSATAYVVADAYDGARIRLAITDELEFAAGRGAQRVVVHESGREVVLNAGGGAALIAYVGHDGLMDFPVPSPAPGSAGRAAIVLACVSRSFFGPHLKQTGAYQLLMTTGLMAPEAYTLEAALQRWFSGATSSAVRSAAAEAYDHYQHCGLKGARGLFRSVE